MIAETVADLKREEGWSPTPYEDSLGFLTIGYGFLIDANKGGKLPQEVGDFWLEHLVKRTRAELDQRLPWLQSQPEDVQRALIQMAYQLGVDGVCRFTQMLDALKASDRKRAANEALDSLWARQTPDRARRVAKLIGG
jgi:lysozyme